MEGSAIWVGDVTLALEVLVFQFVAVERPADVELLCPDNDDALTLKELLRGKGNNSEKLRTEHTVPQTFSRHNSQQVRQNVPTSREWTRENRKKKAGESESKAAARKRERHNNNNNNRHSGRTYLRNNAGKPADKVATAVDNNRLRHSHSRQEGKDTR